MLNIDQKTKQKNRNSCTTAYDWSARIVNAADFFFPVLEKESNCE